MTAKRITIHESTQRSLTRLAFLMVGAAPLFFCIYLCIATFIPGYSRRQAVGWERELSSRLGAPVQIDEAFSLSPMSYRLKDIRIKLPDSQGILGTIDSADVQWDPRGFWSVALVKPTMQLDRLGWLTQLVGQMSQTSGGLKSLNSKVLLRCDQLQLDDAVETISLKDFSMRLIPHRNAIWLGSEFKITTNNKTSADYSELVAELDRAPESTSAKLKLTIKSPVTCSSLAKALNLPTSPALTQALQQSQFSGTFDLRHSSLETSYYFTDSTIRQFDIAQYSGGPSAVLSGTGTLHIRQAMLKSFQLEWLQGNLELGPGRIDAAVLESLSRNLNIQLTRQIAGSVGFDRLSANFIVQPEDLRLYGNPSEGGALLRDGHGVLAWKRDTTTLPLISLVHGLLPPPDQPAFTSRTAPLVRTALIWLPLEENQRKQAELVIHR